MILVCGSCMEREKASVDTDRPFTGLLAPRSARGSVPRQQPKALSTDATFAGGPARSSYETAAVWRWGWSQGAGSPGMFISINRGFARGRKRAGHANVIGHVVRDFPRMGSYVGDDRRVRGAW